MLLGWPSSRCILCLREATLTEEHVIPQSLGGILAVRFLCKPCNDELGHREEAGIKQDPAIALAVEQVRSSLPDVLSRKLLEGQEYFANGPGGRDKGYMKDAVFSVKNEKKPDGSILLSTKAGRDLIGKQLAKSGVRHEAILNKLQEFETAPEDSFISINDELTVVKWSAGAVRAALNGKPMTDGAVLKIAYEFLACILGNAIYEDEPALVEARDMLRGGNPLGPCVRLERLRAPGYGAFHGIAFQGNEPNVIVQIRLFGWLAFRIHFNHMAINAPRLAYTHRLDCGTEAFGTLPDGPA